MARTRRKSPASDAQIEATVGESTVGEATSSESPELSGSETEEIVFTCNQSTGEVIRIERLDASGGRQELTEEEYAQVFGQGDQGSEEQGGEGFAIAHQQVGFEQGYYHGLAEYEGALSAQATSGFSPEEEAAYHQGVADYHALVTGQV